jgi:hypothetical protein
MWLDNFHGLVMPEDFVEGDERQDVGTGIGLAGEGGVEAGDGVVQLGGGLEGEGVVGF